MEIDNMPNFLCLTFKTVRLSFVIRPIFAHHAAECHSSSFTRKLLFKVLPQSPYVDFLSAISEQNFIQNFAPE